MSLGLVTVGIIGNFSKHCGVMRLEAGLQPLKEEVRGEEIVTARTNHAIEMFDCKEKGKKDGDNYKKTYLWCV